MYLKCNKCNIEKPLGKFLKRKHNKNGVGQPCRQCNYKRYHKEYQEYRDNHKEYYREYKYQQRYGLSSNQVDSLKRQQKNLCAICYESFTNTFHVDHCHTTGLVRGLLCYPCNQYLGYIKDSSSTLEKAALYLIKEPDVKELKDEKDL